jgi:branched-chain amino acid aminotransferase
MTVWVGTRTGGGLTPNGHVSVLDHGFTVADGVFETMKVTSAGAFAVSRHLRRLLSSAAHLGLEAPDPDVVREAIDQVAHDWSAQGGEHGRLRVTYTSGPGPLGSDRGDGEPTLVVAATSTNPWPDTTDVVRVDWTRNERSAVAGVKTTSYAENVVALRAAHARGASEAVLANTSGNLCEGTSTNVFVVVDGIVLTPPETSGCLAGITRELVLEWFDVIERDLPFSVLDDADEVFLTSSTRDVHPVVRVDDRRWTSPGVITLALRREFTLRAAESIDP